MNQALASDVAYVLGVLQPMLIARGIPADGRGPLAFGLAMDARIQVRQRTATIEQRDALADARHVLQQTTRAILYGLGLLSAEQVDIVPRDEDGRDRQLAELFPIPTAALLDAAEAYLADMVAADAGAGDRP